MDLIDVSATQQTPSPNVPPREGDPPPTQGLSSTPGDASGHPVVSTRELYGWYAFAWASEPISAVAISGFFPLFVQELALAAAGFPRVCPNVVASQLAQKVFPQTPNATAYLYTGLEQPFWPSTSCRLYNNSVFCPGLPSTSEECLQASGRVGDGPYSLRAMSAGVAWDPTAYVTALIAIATGLQLLVFTSLGSLSDYGSFRKRILGVLSVFCIIFSVSVAGVGDTQWTTAGFLFSMLMVSYGATFVQYNSYLPLLAAKDPLTLAALSSSPGQDRETVFRARMNTISSYGYGWGYVGAIVVLVVCVGVTVASSSAVGAYRTAVVLAGLWFLLFGWVPFLLLKPRPGPPLPVGGKGVCLLPWGEVWDTLRQAKKLPNTFLMLSAWFLFGDGMNLIGNIGSQYANAYVVWDPIPKGLGLASMLLIVPVFAAAGNFWWVWVERKYGFKAWQIVAINCVLCALVPFYGLLGLVSPYLGFRRWYDMMLGVCVYGFQVGSIQSYSRSAYGALIPRGLESRFFGLWSFVDKGSSWIGPAVVSGIIQGTGSFRLAFLFPLCVLLPPIFILYIIDWEKGSKDAADFSAKYSAREKGRGAGGDEGGGLRTGEEEQGQGEGKGEGEGK